MEEKKKKRCARVQELGSCGMFLLSRQNKSGFDHTKPVAAIGWIKGIPKVSLPSRFFSSFKYPAFAGNDCTTVSGSLN